MQAPNEYTHRFEDLDDWFDFVFEGLIDVVRNWISLSRLSIDNKDLSKEVLRMLIESEFEDQYDKTHVVVEKKKEGHVVSTIILKNNRESDRRKPI